MNLIIILPAALILLGIILYLSRGRKSRGGGAGLREDSTEPPELTGDAQWRQREKR